MKIEICGDSNFWIRRMMRYKVEAKGWPYWESIRNYHETGYPVVHYSQMRTPIPE